MYFRALITSDPQHPLERRGKAVVTDLLAAKPPALLTGMHSTSSLHSLAGLLFPPAWHSDLPGGVISAQAINIESY